MFYWRTAGDFIHGLIILVHAAVAMGAIYYGESALVGRLHVRLIAPIGLGALVGVLAIARGTFSVVRKAETFVIGKTVTRVQAPQLWREVEAIALRLGALQPDNLVVGLDPNFFVTEVGVICLDGSLNGRTLYCSLPLCRILSKEELTSVIGHELGHFKGCIAPDFLDSFFDYHHAAASRASSL